MKRKILLILLIFVSLFTGCDILYPVSSATPQTTFPVVTNTYAPYNTIGITPNITRSPTIYIETTISDGIATSSPSPYNTPVVTATSEIINQNIEEMKSFLPQLNTELRFFGIAETGHYGKLKLGYTSENEAMYEFNGIYDDGMGVPDEFSIQYFFDYARGTITEKAGYNERLGKNEFHSKLHNIVVLKFPLFLGSEWGHSTTIDGKKYWVNAQVIEYDGTVVKVLYTAEDVNGYYNNTYFEIRTYEKVYGITSFGNIMPGEVDLSGVDTSDEIAVREYIINMYMFGYSLFKD